MLGVCKGLPFLDIDLELILCGSQATYQRRTPPTPVRKAAVSSSFLMASSSDRYSRERQHASFAGSGLGSYQASA